MTLGVADKQGGLPDDVGGRFCAEALPERSICSFPARARDRLFPDEAFADLVDEHMGRRSVPPSVLATVMVLRRLEGLSDRAARERSRSDDPWRYAAGVGGSDANGWASFSHTVLVDMREHLRRATNGDDDANAATPQIGWDDEAAQADLVGSRAVDACACRAYLDGRSRDPAWPPDPVPGGSTATRVTWVSIPPPGLSPTPPPPGSCRQRECGRGPDLRPARRRPRARRAVSAELHCLPQGASAETEAAALRRPVDRPAAHRAPGRHARTGPVAGPRGDLRHPLGAPLPQPPRRRRADRAAGQRGRRDPPAPTGRARLAGPEDALVGRCRHAPRMSRRRRRGRASPSMPTDRGARQLPTIPTTGSAGGLAPVEPWNWASPKANTPPSAATSQ